MLCKLQLPQLVLSIYILMVTNFELMQIISFAQLIWDGIMLWTTLLKMRVDHIIVSPMKETCVIVCGMACHNSYLMKCMTKINDNEGGATWHKNNNFNKCHWSVFTMSLFQNSVLSHNAFKLSVAFESNCRSHSFSNWESLVDSISSKHSEWFVHPPCTCIQKLVELSRVNPLDPFQGWAMVIRKYERWGFHKGGPKRGGNY